MKPTNDAIREMLDLPAGIKAVENKLNGLKSDKVKQVRKVDASEARHRLRISKEGGYSNAEDRKAALLLACEDDPKHAALVERLDSLTGMIRAAEAEIDLMRRTRAGIQAQAGLHIVNRLEELLKDKDLATAIGSQLLA